MSFTVILLSVACLVLGAATTFILLRMLGRNAEVRTMRSSITERIRAVGKLTGLEVMSKEIVTQTKGLNWLPPLLLSQARLAMIFHFEKQYFVDLSRLEKQAVHRVSANRFIITLPPIEGHLNLLEVIPYDIQSGKLLGLLDVFKMDAEAQGKMMQQAQVEAGKLYQENAPRYESEARRAVARQVNGLLELFEVSVEVQFADETDHHDLNQQQSVKLQDDLHRRNSEIHAGAGDQLSRNGSQSIESTRSPAASNPAGAKKRRRFFQRSKQATAFR